MIGKSRVAIEDCTNAISLIGSQTCFNDSQKSKLLAAFQTKIQSDAGGDGDGMGGSSSQGQKNVFIEHYMTADLWDKFEDKQLTEDIRVDAGVDFCHNVLGMKFADVETRKRVIAIMHLCIDAPRSSRALKATYDLFATTNMRKRKFRAHLPQKMKIYPQDPQNFIAISPGSYKEDNPPVPTRLSPSMIDDVVMMVPARGNNNLLKTGGPPMQQQQTAIAPLGMPVPMGMDMGSMRQGMQMFQSMLGMFQMMNQGGSGSPVMGQHGRGSPTISVHHSPQRMLGAPIEQSPLIEDDVQSVAPPPQAAPGPSASAPQGSDDSGAGGAPPQHQLEEDDIDQMIGLPVKTTMEPSHKIAKPSAKNGAGVKAPKPGITKSIVKQRASSDIVEYTKHSPPKFGVAFPLVYNGCKVYRSTTRFRVVPFPGKSVYDKPFVFKSGVEERAQFASMIEYCKKPSIPSTSANKIK